MTINGVPLHPLVVHAAVVFVPLAVLAVLTLLVPRWRWASRWVALVVVALAAGSVQLAAMTGDDLKHRVGGSALIETHEMWAGRLQAATWVLAALTLVAFGCCRTPRPCATAGTRTPGSRRWSSPSPRSCPSCQWQC